MQYKHIIYKISVVTLFVPVIIILSPVKTFAQKADTIYNAAEHAPNFPGGFIGFHNFLNSNLHYPAPAKQQNIQGKVIARLVIEKDGSLSDIKVLSEPGGGLGEEAVRVLKLSPKWIAGTQNGQPVRVQYTIPVNFTLAEVPQSRGAAYITLKDTTGGKIFSAVEIQPSFPGGEGAFSRFLAEHILYPAQAKQRNVTGRVFIQFVIERNGSLSDIKILRDPGYGLGDEAVRVIKQSPHWLPGIQNGKPVRVQYTVPVNFSLN